MHTKAPPVVSIGHVSDQNTVTFSSHQEATQAWLMLASMGVPAALCAGADGWYPNNLTTAWRKPVEMDFSIVPDITLKLEGDSYLIESCAMRCEFRRAEPEVWKLIAEIIREYRDRIEADCWEVAR